MLGLGQCSPSNTSELDESLPLLVLSSAWPCTSYTDTLTLILAALHLTIISFPLATFLNIITPIEEKGKDLRICTWLLTFTYL